MYIFNYLGKSRLSRGLYLYKDMLCSDEFKHLRHVATISQFPEQEGKKTLTLMKTVIYNTSWHSDVEVHFYRKPADGCAIAQRDHDPDWVVHEL